ncbi:hypothetical protein ACFOLC_07045 [Lysobacter cavernae]|uniref:Uncharacterized protein n=1 Tax=Lysobacter cavernae TaxID=1685901 RepID=A0ABV7RMA8_9GAMM
MLPTDAGMHGLWDPHSFADVCTRARWEARFMENSSIERSIANGSFVPIYVHTDGSPMIEVRTGLGGAAAALTPIEQDRVVRTSRPYLFRSQGLLSLSGIEYISGMQDAASRTIALAPGKWTVRIMDLRADVPGQDPETVPDFVALINPESIGAVDYARSVETFD